MFHAQAPPNDDTTASDTAHIYRCLVFEDQNPSVGKLNTDNCRPNGISSSVPTPAPAIISPVQAIGCSCGFRSNARWLKILKMSHAATAPNEKHTPISSGVPAERSPRAKWSRFVRHSPHAASATSAMSLLHGNVLFVALPITAVSIGTRPRKAGVITGPA